MNTVMTDLIIKNFPYDLSSHAALALIGQHLKSDIALLSLGKNGFYAIENFRGNNFFKRALDLA